MNRHSKSKRRCSLLLVGATALLLLSGTSGAAAGEPVQQNESDFDTQPDDGNYVVEVNPHGPGDVHISIAFYYSPRSPTERMLARNSTLDADWFRGDEILEGAVQYRNRTQQDFEVQWDGVGVSYTDRDDRIVLSRNVNWPGFMQDTDRVVLGPGFASRLEDGDEFEVLLDYYDWDDWSANYEETGGEAGVSFNWTIGNDSEPRLVLNRSDYKSHEGDELGPTPFVLHVIALALIAGAARRRQ